MHLFLRSRTLLLLALFQLAGGPLVLMGVAMLGKATVKEVAREGWVKGVAHVVSGDGWHSDGDELNAALDDTAPSTKSPRKPAKAKDGKQISPSLAWSSDNVPTPALLHSVFPQQDETRFLSAWPNGPPVPPPRGV